MSLKGPHNLMVKCKVPHRFDNWVLSNSLSVLGLISTLQVGVGSILHQAMLVLPVMVHPILVGHQVNQST